MFWQRDSLRLFVNLIKRFKQQILTLKLVEFDHIHILDHSGSLHQRIHQDYELVTQSLYCLFRKWS